MSVQATNGDAAATCEPQPSGLQTEDITLANRNWLSGGKIFSGFKDPVEITCQFTVAPANGLGVTGTKGPYVQNVFMHTSTTPAAGNRNPATPNIAITNPNPASGTIVVQLQDPFARLLEYDFSITQQPNGTPVKIDNSAMTAGVAYTISTLGNASAAKWLAIGVPAGVTPAVGVSFIAASDGGSVNTSTSRVAPSAAAGSNIFSIEMVGNPTLSANPSVQTQGFGAQLIMECRNDSSSDAPAIATPATGTVICLRFLMATSSTTINGE